MPVPALQVQHPRDDRAAVVHELRVAAISPGARVEVPEQRAEVEDAPREENAAEDAGGWSLHEEGLCRRQQRWLPQELSEREARVEYAVECACHGGVPVALGTALLIEGAVGGRQQRRYQARSQQNRRERASAHGGGDQARPGVAGHLGRDGRLHACVV